MFGKKKKKTVDDVISTLAQMEQDLQVISEQEEVDIENLESQKRAIDVRISSASQEKGRAERISTNLQKLLS